MKDAVSRMIVCREGSLLDSASAITFARAIPRGSASVCAKWALKGSGTRPRLMARDSRASDGKDYSSGLDDPRRCIGTHDWP